MPQLHIKFFEEQDYAVTFSRMREFTDYRESESADEFWCLQHSPVFTLGANADKSDVLNQNNIPIIQSDRGGQVTYHGPGQAITYLMIDLRRIGVGVKQLVEKIEQAIVGLLNDFSVESEARADAHGVYVNNEKIASLGLRIRNGCSYHGLALNVDMELSPFSQINPCGFPGLKVTQLKDLGVSFSCEHIQMRLNHFLCEQLGYQSAEIETIGQ